jgi:hypothetical protein
MLLEFNYALSYRACETQETWFLHLATLVSAAAVAAAGFWGWSASRGWRQLPERLTPPVGHETSETRARWMGHASVAFSIWFVIVILTMEIPLIVLRTCQ